MTLEPSQPARHIVSVVQSFKGGGVERALLALARGWIAHGRRVTLVVGEMNGPLAGELPEGVATRVLGSADYRALFGLSTLMRELKPDVLFVPGNHYTSVGAVARLRLGRACPPVVAKVSNALVRPDMGRIEAWGYRRWLRLHPLFCDRIVAMTPAMVPEVATLMGVPAERVGVIEDPLIAAPEGLPPPPMPGGRFLLGLGRLTAQKRWDRLIAALPELEDRTVRLLILGEGELRGDLEAQVAALGLDDRVMMPGHVADATPAIRRAAAMVLTSDFEGVPAVAREALREGTPVVATDSSAGLRDVITGPERGDIVPREDRAALVAALDRWLARDAIRPDPVPQTVDPAAEYLALFDAVVAQRGR